MQLADARVSERPLFSERDRWFESAFLQRRVTCELRSRRPAVSIFALPAATGCAVFIACRPPEIRPSPSQSRLDIWPKDSPTSGCTGSAHSSEPLAARGLDVCYETVRRWVLKFGPLIARKLRQARPRPSARWHVDEMVVRIAGKRMCLWRAVDHEGEVLDMLVQRHRRRQPWPQLSGATDPG